MPGPEQVHHNVEQVARSNASELPEETIGKGADWQCPLICEGGGHEVWEGDKM